MEIISNKKNNIYVVIYYAILLLMLASRKDATSEPSLIIRIGFLIAVITPCIFSKSVSYPAIITMFLTISRYGFAYSYMPYMTYIYAFITLIVVLIYSRYNKVYNIKIPPFLVFFTIYVFLVDTITGIGNSHSKFPEDIFYCYIILLCFFVISSKLYTQTIKQLPYIFVIITIVLSLYFLLNRTQFSQDYGHNSGLERSGWTDPNYFGMVIGIGTIIGFIKLMSINRKYLSLFEKIVYIFGIIISIPALVINASRGALLSVIVSFVIVLLFSNVKIRYKIFIVTVCLLGMVYLYNNNYFELLEYRINNDDSTGSGRTTIWTNKLQAYINGSPMNWIFGYGYAGGAHITGSALGFHNEFVAFIVDYGIIGLFALCYMLYYPIKCIKRNNNNYYAVIALTTYITLCLMTLEPLSLAIPTFYVLYLYIVLLSKTPSYINFTTY